MCLTVFLLIENKCWDGLASQTVFPLAILTHKQTIARGKQNETIKGKNSLARKTGAGIFGRDNQIIGKLLSPLFIIQLNQHD